MWGVIWVREKELRLDIHLFFCTPIREPHLFPCDVKSENFFPFILHTSIGDNLKHPVSTVTYDLGVLKKTDAVLQSTFSHCGNVWLSRETPKRTDDKDSSSWKSNSHTLEIKPLPAGTDPYENYVTSWPLLSQNIYNSGTFLSDLKRLEGKIGARPFSLGGDVRSKITKKPKDSQQQSVWQVQHRTIWYISTSTTHASQHWQKCIIANKVDLYQFTSLLVEF